MTMANSSPADHAWPPCEWKWEAKYR
jgi:hypothetical protein